MKRNTVKVSECSDSIGCELFLVKMESSTSYPLSQSNDLNAADIIKVYISFYSCSEY